MNWETLWEVHALSSGSTQTQPNSPILLPVLRLDLFSDESNMQRWQAGVRACLGKAGEGGLGLEKVGW